MRILLALAVMVVGLVAWLSFAPRHSAPNSADLDLGSIATSAPSGQRVATELDLPTDASAPTRVVEPPLAKPAVAPVAVAAGPACRLIGRVVNDLGEPIAGARLRLQEWGEFPEVTASHETTAGAGGFFSLVIAGLASTKQSLSITALPFHTPAERWFGDVSAPEGLRLSAGVVDVGTIELARCGTIEGRVISDAGEPVGGVGVLLRSTQFGPLGTTTDKNGLYSVPQVQPDPWVVTVKHDEWLQRGKLVVEAVLSRVTTAPDLVLTSAPSITGVVVDAAGAPIPGISVEGLGSEVYALARAASGEDGAFVLTLPEGQLVTLSIGESCAYRGFGGRRGDPTCTFAPGARDVRIVLERTPVMTFRVVDAATSAPVERFGLWVFCGGAGWNTKGLYAGEATIADHPGGTVALSYGASARVSVVAAGFAPLEGAVVADPSTPNVQTIALVRGSSITGRVLIGGKAAALARVSCARESTADRPSDKVSRQGFGRGWNRDFDQVPPGSSAVDADVNGAFEIDDLAAGPYALRIVALFGARTLLPRLVVPAAGALALGDIEIAPEAVVRGVMRAGPDRSPAGAVITFEDYREVRVENEDGRFELGGFEAGPHWLVWRFAGERRNLDSADMRRVDFYLDAGQTREVVIDAAANAPCSVTVRVTRNGQPLANAGVSLRRISDDAPPFPNWHALGRTNRDGVMAASPDAGVRGRIVVFNEAKQAIGWSAEEIELVAGGRHECSIEIKTGTLVVLLPPSLPHTDMGRIVLKGTEGNPLIAYAGRKPQKGPNPGLEWTSDRIDFGEMSTDVKSVRITFERFERDTASDEPKAGRWIEMRPPFDAQVQIRDGAETRVVVP